MGFDPVSYAMGRKAGGGGGGGGVTVEPLSVRENGVYNAPTGKAYSPVTVAVPRGKGYAKGTYTLASDNSQLSFNPGIDFTPSVVKIAMRTPIYGQNATIGAVYISLSGLAIGADARQFLYTALETRTSYSDYAAAQSDNYVVTQVGDPTFSSTGFTFVSRSNAYLFFAGEYTWEAWE